MRVGLQTIADGFVSPVGIVFPNDGTGRRFVVDQIGRIFVVNSAGTVLTTPFLDVTDRMVTLNLRDERGLLSMALHPDFAANGRFFVCYNAPRDAGDPAGFNSELRISEFHVSADDDDVADPDSEIVLLDINKPASNHNGGQLAFGPDEMLYVSVGDGGGNGLVGDDGTIAGGTSQSLTTLLGKILRINVALGPPFDIPSDNPFVGVAGARGEIWALGFRNPWRFSFDSGGDHRLFAGDVGQNLYEEIDIVEAGGNYGWQTREGAHCYDPSNPSNPPVTCDDTDARGAPLIDPIIEQPQVDENGDAVGVSIIGGFVCRGDGVPGLSGDYVFGQWTSQNSTVDGRLFAATENTDGSWTTRELTISDSGDGTLGRYILAFGQDAEGEIYVLTATNSGPTGTTGRVDKLVIAP
ncbi:MAG: PQQ-dependent sugar dehydrogenase [Phycisphaerales bacterium]|nr:PQQ-dependent sugar dehydrogenase [Phycisphaerales bacterium]MCB9854433.1 PQQ-dependent sugar dehydrogenase [Phycisphaerales bacterium]